MLGSHFPNMFRTKAMNFIAVNVVCLLSLFPSTFARLCEIENRQGQLNITNASQTQDVNLYQCPRPEDPPHFTDCCFSGTCCERKYHGFISGLDDRILIAISVGVIISCVISSVLLLICCFCSGCPLYSVCHSKYQHNDTIAFSTKEELEKLNGMPNEDYKMHHGYEPNAVQVRPVLYDA